MNFTTEELQQLRALYPLTVARVEVARANVAAAERQLREELLAYNGGMEDLDDGGAP